MDELKRVADALASMSDAERQRALRAIDGAPRPQKQEQPSEYRPLPSARRMGVSVRVKVNGA
ncbi:hypothetical protein [Streptomyces sp. IBSBF 2950]|uniref:hypothetical protein n=1 Tax=Streptomyces sp. IBSBF 2950 TaxID=2903528 RepID=UPI002FDBD369